jgi:hypothetical protein
MDGVCCPSFLAGLTALHTARYDWKSLPEGSVVVDVGGGIGTVTKVLAKAHPHLKFIIQDQHKVVEDGLKVSTDRIFRACLIVPLGMEGAFS